MNSISISELKINPSKAIQQAGDFPVAIENRNSVKAYIIGKDLYEALISHLEDTIDRKVVKKTDFSAGRDFEDLAKELGL